MALRCLSRKHFQRPVKVTTFFVRGETSGSFKTVFRLSQSAKASFYLVQFLQKYFLKINQHN